jgi:Dyp-type peroxidase family
MPTNPMPVREAPTVTLLRSPSEQDPTRPDASKEPELAVRNVQGNILAGFNKDHQVHLYLRILDGQVEAFRQWLGRLIPFIATTSEVLAFNRLFKEVNKRRGVETRTVMATWVNLAVSFRALKLLAGDGKALSKHADNFEGYRKAKPDEFDVEKFTDAAFREGMAKRSVDVLADPPDAAKGKQPMEGNRHNWLFGGPGNEPDLVVIVASDSAAELGTQVAQIEDTIYSGRTGPNSLAHSGVAIIYKQYSNTLPAPLTGHEHFGFLDGVSQPGIRGRISPHPHDVLTLRQNPEKDQYPNQGKPGQDVLWPGEFVFGYPGQDPKATDAQGGITKAGPNSLTHGGPEGGAAGPIWAQDGSYLVVRRLRQDVAKFHKFLADNAPQGMPSDRFGASLVGRWTSGAPIIRRPTADDPPLGNDDCANNHFEFGGASNTIPKPVANGMCADERDPQSPGDVTGARCPFAGHIRKAYPRDDTGTSPLKDPISEVTTQTHRLLRRGIPFGDPYYPAPDPGHDPDTGNRGLLFACYQTSIERQFEFVTHSWVNNPEFKDKSENGQLQSGHDLIIGQNNEKGSRARRCVLRIPQADGSTTNVIVNANDEWVIPTGGGYFFAPSIDALCLLTGQSRT